LSENTEYDKVIKELTEEYKLVIGKYAPKLHEAAHKDNHDVTLSHIELVTKIQEDCIRVCSDVAHGITFSGAGEQEVIEEILKYNYDRVDIEHMIKIENVNLFLHLQSLRENCIKRTDPEWFQFGIHEQLQNGKINPGPIGSKRTQFCKCCGEQIYISTAPK
jgi:hypothetical protein